MIKSEISDIKICLGKYDHYRMESTAISSISAHLSFPLTTLSDLHVSLSLNFAGIYVVHTYTMRKSSFTGSFDANKLLLPIMDA